MRDKLKLIIKYVLRFILKVYYVFPIKKQFFFMSTIGKSYSCNPKYLFESILKDERFSEYSFVWCFITHDYDYLTEDPRVRIVYKKNKFAYFYHLLTSKVVVYNCGGFSYAPIRKTQFLLETWHGGGTFKRVNLTVENKSKASKRGVEIASNDISAFIGTCEVNNQMFIREGMGFKGNIINSGFPRNDVLFNNDAALISSVKTKLNVYQNAHYVLYAPTFKGSEHNAVNMNSSVEAIDPVSVKKALKNRFGGEWYFATRGHQYAGDLSLKSADFDWSDYSDMQELLLVADVLITDYSSSVWDYSLTTKPCFLYVPDLDIYEKKERGFLTPISEWPAIFAKSNKELSECINSFNSENYKAKVYKYLEECGNFEKGNACLIVKDYLLKVLS